MLPRQFSSFEEAQTYTEMGDQMSESTSLISSSNAVLNILMQTSLNQFWSLINSQQIVIQLPLMDAI